MSLLAALSNATSGLAVAQHALDVTANNVANVNTEGYTRKLAQQEAVVLDGRGAGARALDPARAVDEFLTARIMEQASVLGRSEALSELHAQVQERLFGAPGEAGRGLGARIGDVATAAQALAAGPNQPGLALSLVGAADALARELGTAGAEVQGLRREIDQEIGRQVEAINGELAAVHQLNLEIVRAGPQAALLDRRDALLQSLAGRLDLALVPGEHGAVSVYTRSGQPLVDGGARQLFYEPSPTVGPTTGFGAIRAYRADQIDRATGEPAAGAVGTVLVSGGIRAELTPELAGDAAADADQRIVSTLRGGRLQGLLEARDRVLPGLADQLGELADLTRHALNAAHNDAVPQPPSARLAGTRTDTSGFAAAARSGTAYLAVVDRSNGTVAATIAVDLAAAGSAAAVAAQIAAGLGGYGTAGLNATGALEITADPGYGLALAEGDGAVAVTDAAGRTRSFGLAHYFGLNDLIVADGPRPTDLAVRPDVRADTGLLSRAMLDVTPGPPATGVLGGTGDARGARALAAAFTTELEAVGRASLPAGSYRLADYAAEIVAVGAVAASAAESGAENDRALADALAVRQASSSGVNLDEELSRLVLYQQAYSVSARLVSIVDQLLDELLAIGR